jgi:hypothetical protein
MPEEALRTWKQALVAINQKGLRDVADRLLFLAGNNCNLPTGEYLHLSGDGVVQFADLIGAGLVQATFHESSSGGGGFPPSQVFSVGLTTKGEHFVAAWKGGNMGDLRTALSTR